MNIPIDSLKYIVSEDNKILSNKYVDWRIGK